jgi:hypothetical protein
MEAIAREAKCDTQATVAAIEVLLPRVFDFASAFCLQDLALVCSAWLSATRDPGVVAAWLVQFGEDLLLRGEKQILQSLAHGSASKSEQLLKFLRTQVLCKFPKCVGSTGIEGSDFTRGPHNNSFMSGSLDQLKSIYVAARWGFDGYIQHQKMTPDQFGIETYILYHQLNLKDQWKAREVLWEALPGYLDQEGSGCVGGEAHDSVLHVAATCGHARTIRAIVNVANELHESGGGNESDDSTATQPYSDLGYTEGAAAAAAAASAVADVVSPPHQIKELDLNAGNGFGASALCTAAYHGQASAAVELLNAGAASESKNGTFHQTALCVAASRGHLDVAKVLLRYGACPFASDADGWDALRLASSKQHNEIRDLISARQRELREEEATSDRIRVEELTAELAAVVQARVALTAVETQQELKAAERRQRELAISKKEAEVDQYAQQVKTAMDAATRAESALAAAEAEARMENARDAAKMARAEAEVVGCLAQLLQRARNPEDLVLVRNMIEAAGPEVESLVAAAMSRAEVEDSA